MDRIEDFFVTLGNVERIQGEVFVCKENSDNLELGHELPSNEVVNFLNAFHLSHLSRIQFSDPTRR